MDGRVVLGLQVVVLDHVFDELKTDFLKGKGQGREEAVVDKLLV